MENEGQMIPSSVSNVRIRTGESVREDCEDDRVSWIQQLIGMRGEWRWGIALNLSPSVRNIRSQSHGLSLPFQTDTREHEDNMTEREGERERGREEADLLLR